MSKILSLFCCNKFLQFSSFHFHTDASFVVCSHNRGKKNIHNGKKEGGGGGEERKYDGKSTRWIVIIRKTWMEFFTSFNNFFFLLRYSIKFVSVRDSFGRAFLGGELFFFKEISWLFNFPTKDVDGRKITEFFRIGK